MYARNQVASYKTQEILSLPREKLVLDKETNEVKVIVPETSQPEAEEILNRHGPDEVQARPYEAT